MSVRCNIVFTSMPGNCHAGTQLVLFIGTCALGLKLGLDEPSWCTISGCQKFWKKIRVLVSKNLETFPSSNIPSTCHSHIFGKGTTLFLHHFFDVTDMFPLLLLWSFLLAVGELRFVLDLLSNTESEI